MSEQQARVRVGISGWTYPPWRKLRLGPKLGPVLWQLPPTQRFDPGELEAFFELLPKTLRETERLAREHEPRLSGRASVGAEENDRPLWRTLEVRHPSFADARYVELLRSYGVASCVADSAGLYPVIENMTADFGARAALTLTSE